MSVSRRQWLEITGASAARAALADHAAPADDLPAPIAALTSMTGGVSPIGIDERKARLARAQKLMA